MSARPYKPEAGGLPARALAHLRSLPAGTWLSSAVLADAVGHGTDSVARNMAIFLKGAVAAGLIQRRKQGNLLSWALGTGKPPPPPDQDDTERDAEEERARSAERAPPPPPDPALGSVFTIGQAANPEVVNAAVKSATSAGPRNSPMPQPPAPAGLSPAAALQWQLPAKPCAPQADTALDAKFDAVLGAALLRACAPEQAPPEATLRQPGTRQRRADLAQAAALRTSPAIAPVAPAASAAPAALPPEEATEPDGHGFRCTLWSSGEIVLRLCTGQTVRLSVEDATVLVNYLCRVTGAVARSA